MKKMLKETITAGSNSDVSHNVFDLSYNLMFLLFKMLLKIVLHPRKFQRKEQ